MTMPLISVIVPVYNGEKHLASTLNSIINQDYENLEIIFVNDASTDNTLNIAEEVLKNSKRRLKIINQKKISGVSTARNAGIDASNGKYICFCDGDDLLEKNFVSSLCNEAESTQSDLVFCGIKIFFEGENKFVNYTIKLKEKFIEPQYYLRAWSEEKIGFRSACNVIFKKTFIDGKNLRFNETCKLGEDMEFILKAIAAASRMSFINGMYYIYVHHHKMTTVRYREDAKSFDDFALAAYRAVRPIIRLKGGKKIKNYALNYRLADVMLKRITYCARRKAPGDYEKRLRILKHQKVREILFSSVKFFFRKPELFFKSLMLLTVPKVYYKIRRKMQNEN